MKLERTTRNLMRMQQRDRLAVEDALNFFYDFCQDVKESTGIAVDASPADDADTLYKRLPWTGRFVLRAAKNNEAMISSEQRRQRLQAIVSDLHELDSKLAEAQQELERETAVRAQLERKKDELNEVWQRSETMHRECEQLRSELERLRTVDITQAAQEAERLKQERAEQLARIEQRKAENRTAQAQVDELKLQLAQAMHELAEAQNEQSLLEKKQQNAGQKRQSLLEEQQSRAEDALAQIVTQKNQLDGVKAAMEQQLGQCQVQIEQENEEIGRLKDGIADSKNRMTQLVQVKQNAMDQRSKLEREVDQLDSVCRELKQQVDELEKQLQQRDFSGQQQRLEQVRKQHEQSLREYQELSRRVGEQKELLRGVQEDCESKRNELLALQSRKAAECAEQENKWNALKQSMEQLEQRKQQLGAAVQSAQTRIAELEQWMHSLEAEELRGQVDRLQRRCKWLSEVQGACRRDWRLLWQGQEHGDETCEKILQQDLSEVGQRLTTYQKRLDEVITCMSSKEIPT
ncbi:MAG: hypothetical protein ACOYIC_04635 [Butyricicoccus sp.]|jgi:chromosome segregation ATPase